MTKVTLLDQRLGQSHLLVNTEIGSRHLILSRYGFLQALVSMPPPSQSEVDAVQAWINGAHEAALNRFPEIAAYHQPITVTATA
jgi:hypothetical protein